MVTRNSADFNSHSFIYILSFLKFKLQTVLFSQQDATFRRAKSHRVTFYIDSSEETRSSCSVELAFVLKLGKLCSRSKVFDVVSVRH